MATQKTPGRSRPRLKQTIQLSLCPEHLEQRVPYLIGNLKEPWPSPSVFWEGKNQFLFDIIYARELLASNERYNLLASHRDSLKGKIVIIGASYEASRDFHATRWGNSWSIVDGKRHCRDHGIRTDETPFLKARNCGYDCRPSTSSLLVCEVSFNISHGIGRTVRRSHSYPSQSILILIGYMARLFVAGAGGSRASFH